MTRTGVSPNFSQDENAKQSKQRKRNRRVSFKINMAAHRETLARDQIDFSAPTKLRRRWLFLFHSCASFWELGQALRCFAFFLLVLAATGRLPLISRGTLIAFPPPRASGTRIESANTPAEPLNPIAFLDGLVPTTTEENDTLHANRGRLVQWPLLWKLSPSPSLIFLPFS